MTAGSSAARALAAATVLAVVPGAAVAGARAAFIDGVYAMDGRCQAWAALEAGGPRNVETVPETLTSEGFKTWEGGCTFESIAEKKKGRLYEARLRCSEGAAEWTEMDTFAVDRARRSITVTAEGKTTRFVKCDSEKGN